MLAREFRVCLDCYFKKVDFENSDVTYFEMD